MRAFFALTICFGIFLLAFLAGAGKIRSIRSHSKPPISDFCMTGEASFAILLYAHNAAPWCERAILSIFEQQETAYRVLIIDDASIDGTFEEIQRVIIGSHQEERVIAIRNPSRVGREESLQRLLTHCQDHEILIPLDAGHWFTHTRVLSRLKEIFQNKKVWSVSGEVVLYPSYKIIPNKEQMAFYAGLLKRG